mmetsp:Transcript_30690/g.74701  ORF Transcript_30690/g.74701 Transcript_30690/m.74701 type:complete len:286 (-) Transcript_30690:118-975(-)
MIVPPGHLSSLPGHLLIGLLVAGVGIQQVQIGGVVLVLLVDCPGDLLPPVPEPPRHRLQEPLRLELRQRRHPEHPLRLRHLQHLLQLRLHHRTQVPLVFRVGIHHLVIHRLQPPVQVLDQGAEPVGGLGVQGGGQGRAGVLEVRLQLQLHVVDGPANLGLPGVHELHQVLDLVLHRVGGLLRELGDLRVQYGVLPVDIPEGLGGHRSPVQLPLLVPGAFDHLVDVDRVPGGGQLVQDRLDLLGHHLGLVHRHEVEALLLEDILIHQAVEGHHEPVVGELRVPLVV